jgi:nickel transport protein
MKLRLALLGALLLSACFPGVSLAHRVNVFAYVDGEAIQTECAFSTKQKVRNGKLSISDRETGETLLEGSTDEQGLFRFRPADAFLRTGHGLRILLNAGEGHRNDWLVSAEELQALAPSGQPEKSRAMPAGQPPPAAAEQRTPERAALDAAELEALLGRVLDAKLAPVKQALARQEDRGPGLRDVIGGLGWILGLLGLAAYLKHGR